MNMKTVMTMAKVMEITTITTTEKVMEITMITSAVSSSNGSGKKYKFIKPVICDKHTHVDGDKRVNYVKK